MVILPNFDDGFFSVKFVMGYPCVRHYIFFIFMVQSFCISLVE